MVQKVGKAVFLPTKPQAAVLTLHPIFTAVIVLLASGLAARLRTRVCGNDSVAAAGRVWRPATIFAVRLAQPQPQPRSQLGAQIGRSRSRVPLLAAKVAAAAAVLAV